MGAAERAFVTTPRLSLRPLEAQDAAAVADAIGNYDVARWLGRVPYPYRGTDAEAFIAAQGAKRGLYWFIHDGDGIVGGISIDGELGYWLKRQAWGLGYATEAALAAAAAHFADPSAGDLISGHYPDNARSARVLEKVGFEDDGTRLVAARALSQQIEGRRVRLTRPRWSAMGHDLSGIRFSATAEPEGART